VEWSPFYLYIVHVYNQSQKRKKLRLQIQDLFAKKIYCYRAKSWPS
jgi:hypothetical protein